MDGTLVFGLPVVSFGLQYCLVRDSEYGMAVSALALGVFYIGLATFLWRRGKETLRMMAESFLAFGIVFGSLAIPLALDGRWTSAAWAIEGGAILWIGIRQQRFIPRLFGLLLQAGAGIFFLAAIDRPYVHVPVANSFFMGCNLISLTGLFSGWYLNRNPGKLYKGEVLAATPLMVWGLAWWFGAAVIETHRFIAGRDLMAVWLVHGAASFFVTDL